MARIALLDACVLYPAPLRDLFMRLAIAGLFQARWTAEIHEEWMRNVAANRPDIAPTSLSRCRELMDAHVPDSLVTSYETLIPSLRLPDPDDRHVLAAAIHCGAGHVVTFNLVDFPPSVLAPYSIEAIHPDEFLLLLWDHSQELFRSTVRRQRLGLKKPPKSAVELLGTLEQCGLKGAVGRLRPYEEEL